MQIRFVTISAGALVLAATSPALSHHPSGTGTSSTGGPIVTIPGTTLQQGKGPFYLVFEHYSFDELSDTVLEGAAARDEHTHSLATLESAALGYSYGLTDRLMVSVLLPYVVRTGIREAHHHHEEPAVATPTALATSPCSANTASMAKTPDCKPRFSPASRRRLERPASTMIRASYSKLSSNPVPALGTPCSGLLCRELRDGGR